MSNAIADFWAWWASAGAVFAAALELAVAPTDEMVAELNTHVENIAQGLAWEFGPGVHARHGLSLTSLGDPELRLVAEGWRLSAPLAVAHGVERNNGDDADDDSAGRAPAWDYFTARQAHPGELTLTLAIGGVDIDYARLRVALAPDQARERIGVIMWHPNFADIDEALQRQVAFLALDAAIGEDGVERWLSAIETTTTELPDAGALGELRAAVAAMAQTSTGERYAVLRGVLPSGLPVFAAVNFACKRVDYLLYAMHAQLTVAIVAPNEHGLPGAAEGEQMAALEDEITASLGHHAVFFGRETFESKRIFHWFAVEDGQAHAVLDAWCAAHPERAPVLLWQRDAGWSAANKFG